MLIATDDIVSFKIKKNRSEHSFNVTLLNVTLPLRVKNIPSLATTLRPFLALTFQNTAIRPIQRAVYAVSGGIYKEQAFHISLEMGRNL